MKTVYKTRGTCARKITICAEEGIIKEVRFSGGCEGNLNGISQLVRGMKVKEVVEKLEGTSCGMKKTSCPDQLAKALKELYGSH